MKMKEIGPRGGHSSLAHPLDLPMHYVVRYVNMTTNQCTELEKFQDDLFRVYDVMANPLSTGQRRVVLTIRDHSAVNFQKQSRIL